MNSTPLKDVMAKVAEILGEPIDHVVIRCRSGSRVRIEAGPVEVPEVKPKPEDKRIKTWRDRIVPYMQKMDIPLRRKQIAKGLNIEGNDTSGWFGQSIVAMIAAGELAEDDDRFLTLNNPGTKSD